MNKILFYAPNYHNTSYHCSTSNQRNTSNQYSTSNQYGPSNRCQPSNPHAPIIEFFPLGGGQEISTDGILPTQRIVYEHSVDGIFLTRECQHQYAHGHSLGYLTGVESLHEEIFPTRSPPLCCRNFFLLELPFDIPLKEFSSLRAQIVA